MAVKHIVFDCDVVGNVTGSIWLDTEELKPLLSFYLNRFQFVLKINLIFAERHRHKNNADPNRLEAIIIVIDTIEAHQIVGFFFLLKQ